MKIVTTRPVNMPASAPQALARFTQIASSSTGKDVGRAQRERPEEQLQRIGRRGDREPDRHEGGAQQGKAGGADACGFRCGLVRQDRARHPPTGWTRSPPAMPPARPWRPPARRRAPDRRSPAEIPRQWAAQTAPRRARSRWRTAAPSAPLPRRWRCPPAAAAGTTPAGGRRLGRRPARAAWRAGRPQSPAASAARRRTTSTAQPSDLRAS